MNLKGFILALLAGVLLFFACSGGKGEYGYGWRSVECFDAGKLVYSAKWERCPGFAGTGHAKLESGKIIKGECLCSTGGR